MPSTTIPISDSLSGKVGRKTLPLPDFLFEKNSIRSRKGNTGMVKHQGNYHDFCQWAALPEELRKPKTQAEFERAKKLTPYQTTEWKKRDDFYGLRLKYFWDWMFEEFPNVVYAVIKRAKRKSSADARIFADLIGKKLEVDKPRINMQPIFMIGVNQNDIDRFQIPEGYEDVVEKTVNTFGKPEIDTDSVDKTIKEIDQS